MFIFLVARPAKKSGSTRSEFCEILSPKPPAFCKISLAFRISALRLISPQKISGGVRIAFSPHFPFWKALCFAQRRVARGETLVLHFFLEIGSCECYNDTTASLKLRSARTS